MDIIINGAGGKMGCVMRSLIQSEKKHRESVLFLVLSGYMTIYLTLNAIPICHLNCFLLYRRMNIFVEGDTYI